MAWETRGGRGRYYTRSRKVNGRVVREYVGSGERGDIAASLDALRRARREDEAAVRRAEQKSYAQREEALVDFDAAVTSLVYATLILGGYYYRRGEWRRRRD